MEWNRWIGVFVALLLTVKMAGQVAPGNYIVFFTDKDNTPYSLSSPEDFLSSLALERRQSQGIAIEENDLPVDPDYVQQVTGVPNVTLLNKLRWFNAVTVEATEAAIDSITNLPVISQVKSSHTLQRNPPVKAKNSRGSAKASYAYGPSFTQINMLNGIYLHDQGYMGQGMHIGILDGGFNLAQDATALDSVFDNDQILFKRDFVGVPDPSVFEASTHGTLVLSCMGGFMEDSLIGTAPKADYALLKTEDVSSEYQVEEANWAAAAQYADSAGIDILNVSLSYTTFDDSTMDYTYQDMDGQTTLIARAANIAASKGILVVVSAGNYANDEWHYIGSPGDSPNVLTIGAVGENEEYAFFSSVGPTADGRVKPDVMAMGYQTVLTDLNDGISRGNGTSFSSPVLCGMAACLWQKHQSATPQQVRKAIRQSAHLYENPNDSMGYGIPDFGVADGILEELVGLDQPSGSQKLVLGPNPSSKYFVLRASGKKIDRIQVLGLSGKLVMDKKALAATNTARINLPASMAPGMYFVKVYSGDEVMVKKIMKQ